MVLHRWNLSADIKILWIMSDEKWFHALVPRYEFASLLYVNENLKPITCYDRSNAKACEELGIKRQSYSAHHKKHIGKVMAHCTVGFLFTNSPEEGGKGFLIGCHRCASFRIPLRDIRFSTKDPETGRITFRGNPVKHHRGVPYLVDCNVTGSDPGTPSSPCFPLQSLWEHTLVPSVENLVAPGGPCEGAQGM